MAGCAHVAVCAIPAAGGDSMLFVIYQFAYDSRHRNYQKQRNNDGSEIGSYPCKHFYASLTIPELSLSASLYFLKNSIYIIATSAAIATISPKILYAPPVKKPPN